MISVTRLKRRSKLPTPGHFMASAVASILLLAGCANAIYADGQWQPKDGPESAPQFIVPPGEDPAAHAPSHWGLTDKGTQPARIPTIERPTTNPLGPRPDYEHQPFGNYQPESTQWQPSTQGTLRPDVQYQFDPAPSVLVESPTVERYPGVTVAPAQEYPLPSESIAGSITEPSYFNESAAPDQGGYVVEQPLPEGAQSRLPFLQMNAEEAAYRPSPYHVKPESPSLSEILKTGAYFVSYESAFYEPHFQGNTAVTLDSPSSGFSRDFDFDYLHVPKITIGFESKKGPGIKLTHLELSATSDASFGRSDGVQTATASIFLVGPQRATFLTANNNGERIEATHKMSIKQTSAILFKEIKMPVSRLNGMMGLSYVNIHHTMHATLFDGADVQQGALHGTHYFRGLGPLIGVEYYRPIGHTSFEFLGGATTNLLYGNRDQIVSNLATSEFTRFGADELITITDAKLGAQWVREWGQRYRLFVRGTMVAQTWYGGGTSSNPVGDFGLFGLALAAGLNH